MSCNYNHAKIAQLSETIEATCTELLKYMSFNLLKIYDSTNAGYFMFLVFLIVIAWNSFCGEKTPNTLYIMDYDRDALIVFIILSY